MNDFALELDAFVRSVGINRNSPHSLFLGAGASMSSGVPSAAACVWEWKRAIYCTNNPRMEQRVAELSLPAVREQIDQWLRLNHFWPATGEDDYGYFIEKCLPIPDDRRKFFEDWVRRSRPHVGYRILCLLAESELLRTVWTTNFDGLTARATSEFDLTPVEIGLDSKNRVFRQPARGEILCVALHGDYRYDALKNTASELKAQDETLRAALVERLRTESIIIIGYSGRDHSVMETLNESMKSKDGMGRVFWCGYSDTPSPLVSEFLQVARDNKREAHFVPGVSFDDCMIRLGLHCLEGDRLKRAKAIIGEAEDDKRPIRVAFEIPKSEPTALIKSNAWPIELPSEMFEFDLQSWPKEHVWAWLAGKAGPDVVAVPFKKVLSLGTLDGIRTAFGDDIIEPIVRVPVVEKDLVKEHGATMALMRKALIRSLAKTHSLQSDDDCTLWEKEPYETKKAGTRYYKIYKAARIALRNIDQQMYLTIDPTVHVPVTDDPTEISFAKSLRVRILGYQHNKEYNQDLNRWRNKLLVSKPTTEFYFPVNSNAFAFKIKSAPSFATVTQESKPRAVLPANVIRLVRHTGIEVPEPRLRFGTGVKSSALNFDKFPLRGLSSYGPYDLGLSFGRDNDQIKLAVICPGAESPLLERFLESGLSKHDPARGASEEYVVPYMGFEAIFRVPIKVPRKNDSSWYVLPEPDSHLDERSGALEVSRLIRDALTSLSAQGNRLVLILTPERWSRWRGFSDKDESFDLHDFVKAFCVQRGIATQFLDQDTIDYPDKCRLWWWLSVALYSKAMRTPWVLDGLDAGTAYVGLGYGIDQRAAKGKQIILGCSHLYSTNGEGLQFRLSRIENPQFLGRNPNPFLSLDDARRIGEAIRALYWETHLRLPSRVVVHKLTPFMRDEQIGLRAGLEGVADLELLEINYEPNLRYVRSEIKTNEIVDAMYPVNRGTALRLSNHEALVWLHGSTESVKTNWTYFQGKRRIPGPVVVRRYAGQSPLPKLVDEILGLSKMDWNSGELYSKLPANVLSSKRIAQIGSLLERFSGVSFDYRLFM